MAGNTTKVVLFIIVLKKHFYDLLKMMTFEPDCKFDFGLIFDIFTKNYDEKCFILL